MNTNDTSPPRRGRRREPAKEQTWRKLLQAFAASGQSVSGFCAAHRLKPSSFYFWRREIRRRDSQAPGGSQRVRSGPVAFAQVLVQPPASQDGARLRLSSGRELLLPASWTPEQLAVLVCAVEAKPSEFEAQPSDVQGKPSDVQGKPSDVQEAA